MNGGRLEEAAAAFKKTHDRHVAIFGEDHWRTINTQRNVGMAMLLVDNPDEMRALDVGSRREERSGLTRAEPRDRLYEGAARALPAPQ